MKPSPFSIQGRLSEFFQIMAAETLKNPLTDSQAQSFLEGEQNQIQKEKPKVTYSAALVVAFLAAENENHRQLEDLPQANIGRLSERLLLSVRKKSIKGRILLTGNYDHCFVYNHDSTHFSIMSLSANVRYDCRFFYFHSLMRSTFLVTKGYCVNMVNKIIHGCLQMLNFSSRVRLDISAVRCAHSELSS